MRAFPYGRSILAGLATVAAAVTAGAQLDLGHLLPAPAAAGPAELVAIADGGSAGEGASGPSLDAANGETRPHSFYFTRGVYSGGRGWGWGRGRGTWATDFPEADQHFLVMLRHLTNIDAYEHENPVRLDDPEIRRYPFLYMLEVGFMQMTESEVEGLRDYLLAGGFLMLDDFWGTLQWNNFEQEMMRVFPEYPIVDIPLDHPIFSSVYEIEEILQVPVVNQGVQGGPTHEQDGYTPHVRGIFDEKGRLMMVINWNTDIGDAWEHADHPLYPVRFSTFAFQLGVNYVVYAMTN